MGWERRRREGRKKRGGGRGSFDWDGKANEQTNTVLKKAKEKKIASIRWPVGKSVEHILFICGSLHVAGPHNLTESGGIRRCVFVGVCMVLLEVCHCGDRLGGVLSSGYCLVF